MTVPPVRMRKYGVRWSFMKSHPAFAREGNIFRTILDAFNYLLRIGMS